MKFLPAAIAALGTVCLTLSASHSVQAQFGTPPIVDGIISTGEYNNAYRSPNALDRDLTWNMTWNNTDLFIAVSDARLTEGTVVYLDLDPQTIVNAPGTGTSQGLPQGYDGSSGTLPFQADAILFIRSDYREIRTYNRETGEWREPVVSPGQYAQVGTDARNQPRVREFSIPWALINDAAGRPANFNWLGYIAYQGGGAYGQVPVANPQGIIGSSANFVRYFTVLNTAAGSASSAFGPNGLDSYSHSGLNVTDFGGLNVYDFTLNTPNALITRIGATSTWNVQGNLRVGSGTLNLGDTPAPVTVAGDVRVLEAGALRYLNEDGSLEVRGDIDFDNPASFDTRAAIRLAGNEDQALSGGFYRALTILGNGTKTLTDNNMTVERSLILNGGTLVTGPYSVDLGAIGSLLEENGYLLGTVEATRSVNGPGSNIFGNIGLTLTSPSGAQSFPGSVLVQRITGGFGIDSPTNVPTANKTIRRRFFINASNDNTINTGLAFTYRSGNPDELEGNSASQSLSLYQSTDRVLGYAPVNPNSDLHDNQNRTVVYNGLLNLNGYFSLADGNNPLPVELISFTGKAENTAVRLTWATASEKQNKGFDIEHRTDLSEWKKLSFVNGNGTTNQRNNYTYVDRAASAGNNYYRLRQIDVDGKSVYSQPVTVQMGAVAFTLSPVPATDVLTLNGLGTGKHTTEIYNVRGQRVLSQTFSDEAANTLTVSTLPAGVYMVRVLSADRSVRQARFIKQ